MESLPDRLFVENVVASIRIITILDALHILKEIEAMGWIFDPASIPATLSRGSCWSPVRGVLNKQVWFDRVLTVMIIPARRMGMKSDVRGIVIVPQGKWGELGSKFKR